MHPVIHIVCFLVLAVGLSLGASWSHLGLGCALVLLGYGLAPRQGFRQLARMIARLRWLWLSLFILYFWLTPGIALLPALGVWSPTQEGVNQGLVRVGILATLAASANLLWQLTGRDVLLGAVHWLVSPLQVFGVPADRFALRLVLVLDAVPRIRPLAAGEPNPEAAGRGRLANISATVSRLFRSALEQAARAPVRSIEVPDSGRPPYWQWLVPLAIGIAFYFVGWI